LNKYLENVDSDWFKQRLTGVMLVICGAFGLLIVRLMYLQIIQGQDFSRQSEINSIRLQSVDASRGLVFDRNGTLLVDNRPSFDLSIILKDAKPVERTLKTLSDYIQIPESDLLETIRAKRGQASFKPILLRADIGRDVLAAVEVHRYELPGVIVDISPRRQYIHSNSAAHLLGYLSEINPEELKCQDYLSCKGGDFIGKYGVERTYESYLRGQRGGRQVKVNATGQVVQVLSTVDAQAGHNVFLTIDYRLQQKAEELMAAKVGGVVALDPQNGEILAMVSSPAFDQNAFVSGLSQEEWNELASNSDRPMENKIIQGEYPPASTYKIVTAMAGLEEGVIDENTVFECPGFLPYGNRVFRCWRRIGHGTVNVRRALAESCDVFFYHVGIELGVDRLAWYARACGLGAPTGVDLNPESSGLIPSSAWKQKRIGVPWQKGETLSIAIGQGYNLTTPIQMAALVAAIGNQGVRFKPAILKTIKTAEGRVIYESQPQVAGRLPASAKTLEIVRDGLWQVVNDRKGTGYQSRLKGIDMAGKTGTAQVVGRKKETSMAEEDLADHLKSHAWFVAYAPAQQPRIAVVVMVEHGEHGSSAAAPVASEIIRTYLSGEEDQPPVVANVIAKNPT
jgi:penicillin-binding protein 2